VSGDRGPADFVAQFGRCLERFAGTPVDEFVRMEHLRPASGTRDLHFRRGSPSIWVRLDLFDDVEGAQRAAELH
jgi:hypothetical protein